MRRRAFIGATNVLLAAACLGTVVAAGAAHRVDGEMSFGSAPVAPAAAWSPTYAEWFPDCAATLPAGVVPVAVVEVRGGYPARVPFRDAWRRTHDADPTNHGAIVGACSPEVSR